MQNKLQLRYENSKITPEDLKKTKNLSDLDIYREDDYYELAAKLHINEYNRIMDHLHSDYADINPKTKTSFHFRIQSPIHIGYMVKLADELFLKDQLTFSNFLTDFGCRNSKTVIIADILKLDKALKAQCLYYYGLQSTIDYYFYVVISCSMRGHHDELSVKDLLIKKIILKNGVNNWVLRHSKKEDDANLAIDFWLTNSLTGEVIGLQIKPKAYVTYPDFSVHLSNDRRNKRAIEEGLADKVAQIYLDKTQMDSDGLPSLKLIKLFKKQSQPQPIAI